LSVVGIGTDLVASARLDELLARHGERFLQRCFRSFPTALAPGPDRTRRVAVRWAAKEAFLKALGQEVQAIPYRDIEVADTGPGPVTLILHGRALRALASCGGRKIHLAVGGSEAWVVAWVIIET
jgi:holo-[acyl-carrier protein] synthase